MLFRSLTAKGWGTPDQVVENEVIEDDSNYNILLSSINPQTAYTTGLSLSHTQNFNRFSELLRAAHKRQRPAGAVTETED